MRVTRLRSDDGTVWYVPNGEIRKLANSSRGWAQATVDVPGAGRRRRRDRARRHPGRGRRRGRATRATRRCASSRPACGAWSPPRPTPSRAGSRCARPPPIASAWPGSCARRSPCASRPPEVFAAVAGRAAARSGAPAPRRSRRRRRETRPGGAEPEPAQRARAAAEPPVASGHGATAHPSRRRDPRGPARRDHVAVRLAGPAPIGRPVDDQGGALLRPALRQRRALVPRPLPAARAGPRLAVEATPYLLFYPLAPARVAADLPSTTRFIVLLRDPVQRAISQYWHSCRIHAEDKPLAGPWPSRTSAWPARTRSSAAGGESFAHRNFSYKARGHYAEQLRRWFAVIDRERFLVDGERGALRAARPGPPVSCSGWGWRRLDAAVPVDQRRAPGPARRGRPWSTNSAGTSPLYNEDLFELLGRAALGTLRRSHRAERGLRPPPTWPRPGAGLPGPALQGQRGLVHQHAEPAHRQSPLGPGPRPATGVRRGGRRDRPPPARRGASRGRRGARRTPTPSPRAMPTGVAWTTSSASATSAPDPTRPAAPASAAAASARAAVRFSTTTSAAPASARARITARAAPPAPITRQRLAGGVELRGAAQRRPGTLRRRCESPTSAPSRQADAVDDARAGGPRRWCRRRREGLLLVGHGDRQPGDAAAPASRRAPLRRPRRRPGSATDTQSRPEGVEGGVVQQRRQRMGDGVADHPDHRGGRPRATSVSAGSAPGVRPRRLTRGPGSGPGARWPVGRRRWSENASVPSFDTTTK